MFLAHISEDKLREQSILEHLEGTAELAGEFASAFGSEAWGYGCGMSMISANIPIVFRSVFMGES